MVNQPKKMKILQWNTAGLYKAKLSTLKADLRLLNPALVLLCGTGWNDQHKAVFTAYNPFVLNRRDKRGGGVAILVKNEDNECRFGCQEEENKEHLLLYSCTARNSPREYSRKPGNL